MNVKTGTLVGLFGVMVLCPVTVLFSAPFPDSNRPAPAGADHTFRLSHDYPATLPAKQAPWESINFRTQPEAYIRALLAYALEGNIDPAVDWDGDRNPVRKLYHM